WLKRKRMRFALAGSSAVSTEIAFSVLKRKWGWSWARSEPSTLSALGSRKRRGLRRSEQVAERDDSVPLSPESRQDCPQHARRPQTAGGTVVEDDDRAGARVAPNVASAESRPRQRCVERVDRPQGAAIVMAIGNLDHRPGIPP